jgi:hypothetical protein
MKYSQFFYNHKLVCIFRNFFTYIVICHISFFAMTHQNRKQILQWFHTILEPKGMLLLLKYKWHPLVLLHQYYTIHSKQVLHYKTFATAVQFCSTTVYSGNIHLRRYKNIVHVLLFDIGKKKDVVYVNDYETLSIDSTVDDILLFLSQSSLSSSSSLLLSLSSLSLLSYLCCCVEMTVNLKKLGA